jgi:hypothetical protein
MERSFLGVRARDAAMDGEAGCERTAQRQAELSNKVAESLLAAAHALRQAKMWP